MKEIVQNIWIEKAIDVLERVSTIIAGTLFILNIMNIAIAVFTRYVLFSSFIWTAELSQFMMVWMVLIGAAAALRQNEHMKIDLLLKYLPPMVKKIVAAIRYVTVIFISLFMTVWGFRYANSLWIITTLGLKIPKPIPLFATSIGMGMFLLMYLLLRIAKKPEVRSTHEGV